MKLERFDDAGAAAEAVSQALIERLSPPGPKRLVVTGGRSPGPVYDRLAKADLDWSRVAVTLSDERFTPPTSEQSNERLVRERLLQGHAAAARFVPLKGARPTPDDDARVAEPAVAVLLPFDAVLLGMGEDGHIGSLFPGAPNLEADLSPDAERLVVGVAKAGMAPYLPRISLTGRAFFSGGLVALLIAGEPKRALAERAIADPDFHPPVAALVRQTRAPVRIFWSPGHS